MKTTTKSAVLLEWTEIRLESGSTDAKKAAKSRHKQPRDYDRHSYPERHLIECLFSKTKQYRRVFSRFDKLARNYWDFRLCRKNDRVGRLNFLSSHLKWLPNPCLSSGTSCQKSSC